MDTKEEKTKEKGRYRALTFIKGPALAKEKDADISESELPTWPYLVRKEFLTVIICTILLIVWSVLLDAPLEEHSDPTMTPNPAKAPWYFLGLQEMLVYFDPWIAGVVFPMLIIIGLMAIPYVDFNPKGNGYYTFKERKFALLTFCFGFHILWILLIIIGVFMRGPGWLWFWPWQEWDPHRIVAETNYDLTSFIGIDSKSLLGFIIGGAVVIGYFFMGITIPYRLMKAKESVALEKLGIIKYSIVAFLFLSMVALPIKVFLRLVFHVKYIWVTPWFNI
ncbi:MAG: cytochrome C [Candidatus Jettenia sp.]|uniref:Putative cytochrome-related protein n=1 Tax=Candidatus Jettenia caeni TaxID=247490 RepID=I3IIK6_9BACT|nr:cytochrome c [Candidatus Jettenia sp. AMX1]MBC6929851.1 cytochrome C [Candidatus Jettenia sp.]WKZ16870.1 MAG: cytochrome C [Candidatus Jettenia caeni]KAA0248686.1 MAG: cytochrome C [Candidatus Jettenia sp. AMX1]MCQ3928058.1 cytochrome C [Candidatus Jettenia sp.]MDL1939922.1 cytochrome C [Candidatus Jettenia sp. AMX1]